MKSMFSLVGILVVLAVVGLLVKKQTQSLASVPVPVAPSASVAMPSGGLSPAQGREMQQQVKQAVESAIQPRPPQDGQ